MLKSIPGKPGTFLDTQTGKNVSIVSEDEIYKLRLKTLVVCLADERDRRAKGKRGPDDAFDMGNFVNLGCGTPACVLGTYGNRRDLQDTFELDDETGFSLIGGPSLWHDDPDVLRHFGVTREEAERLFGGSGCNNADNENMAIKFIDDFVAKKYGGP
jgi:hypothetical protein